MKKHSFYLSLLSGAVLSVAAMPALAQDWSGPYIGTHAGYGKLSEADDERLEFDTDQDGDFSDTVNTTAPANAFGPGFCGGTANGNNAGAGCEDDEGGGDFGVRLGYDWRSGDVVFGVVGEMSRPDISDTVTGFSSTPAAYSFHREVKSVTALRGRVGYVMNDYLVYGTAGVAWGDIERNFSTTNMMNSFTPSGGDDAKGYQVGVGAERAIGTNWTVGAEYLYTNLKDEGYVVRVGPGTAMATNPFLLVDPTGTDTRRSEDNFGNHSVRVSLNYRFGM